MKIIIGTQNIAKIDAIQKAFSSYINSESEFISLDVESLVSAQPISDDETLRGAVNRAKNALNQQQGHAAIGLEGGVKWVNHQLYLCNWGALVTAEGEVFTASGAGVPLPVEIAEGIKEGKELGPLMDNYTNRQGIRHKEGAIGVFTNGMVTRSQMFEHIVVQLIGQWTRQKSVV